MISEMPDTARRDQLLARSKDLRERATVFSRRLKDERAREFVQRMVFNHLDDVDTLFLGAPRERPSTAVWESTWLDTAATVLKIAEDAFTKFEQQAERYGGPENVALIG